MPNAFEAIGKGKLVGYVRVSSEDQNPARQLHGIAVDKLFVDHASGKSTDRPQLQACLSYLREDDTLLVHSMDRLARSTADLLELSQSLVERGVTIKFMKEGMEFAPGDRSIFKNLIFTLLAAIAQFERELLLERQREGIRIAKERGVYKGRKPVCTGKKLERLHKLADSGMGATEIAREMQIARSTVYRVLEGRKGKHHDGKDQPADRTGGTSGQERHEDEGGGADVRRPPLLDLAAT